MEKFEKMVLQNQEASKEKLTCAKRAIIDMVKNNELVTVADLTKRTGLSRAYFYKNAAVKAELDKARDLQKGKTIVRPQKVILDKAMQEQLLILQEQLRQVKAENTNLKKQLQKMQKNMKKQDLSFLRSL